MVSGCEEFLYEPDTPLHGDLTDFAYHQRGAVAYVVELWDLFKQVGFERKKRFVDNYVQLTRADMLRIAVWDRDKNESRVVRPWRAFASHTCMAAIALKASPTKRCATRSRNSPTSICPRHQLPRSESLGLALSVFVQSNLIGPLIAELGTKSQKNFRLRRLLKGKRRARPHRICAG